VHLQVKWCLPKRNSRCCWYRV